LQPQLPGAYYDSIVLMQLQRGLAALPGVVDAGVVMGTPANKDVLAQSGLLTAAAQAAGADDFGRALLEDARGAHDEALTEHQALALVGGVVRVGGNIRAYTLGTWLTPSVFCVLIEVADRGVPGLGPFIFREFCRQALADGALWVNTMDDSGLPHLAKSKRLYHPTYLLPNYCVTES